MFFSQIIGDSFLGGDLILGLFFTVFAIIIGLVSSALGIGGGFITTPFLILIGVEPVYAIGTVLFMIIFTSLNLNTVAHQYKVGQTPEDFNRSEKLFDGR